MANAQFDHNFKIANTNNRVQSDDVTDSFAKKGALYKGTNHMGRLIAFEPQRIYNFELQIIGLDQLYTADRPGTGNYYDDTLYNVNYNKEFIHFNSASERILVACSSFNVPNTDFGMIEIPHYNNTTKYAGKVTFGDAQLKVESFLGSFTEQIMTTWARCVYDPRTQNIGFKHDYAKDMFVIQYDSKGGTPRVWKMENAWPDVLPGANWDYASTDRRQMEFTIKCDRCVPDYGIDTRTFKEVNEASANINSITQSSIEKMAGGYETWTYDPTRKTYKNPATGDYIQAFSDTQINKTATTNDEDEETIS